MAFSGLTSHNYTNGYWTDWYSVSGDKTRTTTGSASVTESVSSAETYTISMTAGYSVTDPVIIYSSSSYKIRLRDHNSTAGGNWSVHLAGYYCSVAWSGTPSSAGVTYTRNITVSNITSPNAYVKVTGSCTIYLGYRYRERQNYVPPKDTWNHSIDPKVTVIPDYDVPSLPIDIPMIYPGSYQYDGTLVPTDMVGGTDPSWKPTLTHPVRLDSDPDSPYYTNPVTFPDPGYAQIYWTSGDLQDLTSYFISNSNHSLQFEVGGTEKVMILMAFVWLEEIE